MKILFVAIISILSTSAWAQLRCVDKLLPLPRFSAPHQLSSGEWRPGTEPTLVYEAAQRAINSLLYEKLLCRDDEIEQYTNGACFELDPFYPDLVTCYHYTNVGYFVVTQDSQKNANIIFHRVRSIQK